MIKFYEEDVRSKLNHRKKIKEWIELIIRSYDRSLGDISYIFCSDERILEINKQFLQHDYYTDVITFDYDEGLVTSGDIFISVDTVKSNSQIYSSSYNAELYRVIIHGVLHLCGLKDKSEADEKKMRAAEDKALNFLRKDLLVDDF